MEEQASLPGFLERRLEGSNQMVRQITDESDGIAEKHSAPVFQMPLPGARIERGEKLVFDIHIGPGQGVHQGALAGVGVADQGNRVFLVTAAYFPFFASLDLNHAMAEIPDALINQSAIFLELGFTWPAKADAPRVAGQVGPHPP